MSNDRDTYMYEKHLQEHEADMSHKNLQADDAIDDATEKLKALAQRAIDVQDACNYIAVVNGYAAACKALRELGVSSAELRFHPIAMAWLDKLVSLSSPDFDYAHAACDKLAELGRY